MADLELPELRAGGLVERADQAQQQQRSKQVFGVMSHAHRRAKCGAAPLLFSMR